jgi:IMP dehydrogenase
MSSRDVIAVPVGISNRDAFLQMDDAGVKAAPVLDAQGRLAGVITKNDAVRLELLRPALGSRGELMVAAAIGISGQVKDAAARMLDIGVSAIVLDTAHGHQRRMLEAIGEATAVVRGRVPIIAGNVCTPEGTRALIEAGADIVKVNVGPGAMCTTRPAGRRSRRSWSARARRTRAASTCGPTAA